MKINTKFLVLALITICGISNNVNSMSIKEINVNKQVITKDDLMNTFVSISQNKLLDDKCINCISKIASAVRSELSSSDDWFKKSLYKPINESNKNNIPNDILMKQISVRRFNLFLEMNGVSNNSGYINLFDEIKQCYINNKINQNDYESLLKYLLYININEMFRDMKVGSFYLHYCIGNKFINFILNKEFYNYLLKDNTSIINGMDEFDIYEAPYFEEQYLSIKKIVNDLKTLLNEESKEVNKIESEILSVINKGMLDGLKNISTMADCINHKDPYISVYKLAMSDICQNKLEKEVGLTKLKEENKKYKKSINHKKYKKNIQLNNLYNNNEYMNLINRKRCNKNIQLNNLYNNNEYMNLISYKKYKKKVQLNNLDNKPKNYKRYKKKVQLNNLYNEHKKPINNKEHEKNIQSNNLDNNEYKNNQRQKEIPSINLQSNIIHKNENIFLNRKVIYIGLCIVSISAYIYAIYAKLTNI